MLNINSAKTQFIPYSTDKLYIIIPAYNEEENVESVAREWHYIATKANKESKVVIVDDGSKDNTYAKLQELQKALPQLEIITKQNSGHGATVLYGYRYALENGADYIFQTDSDGQTIPAEFWTFWEQRQQFDIQIGYRKNRKDGLSRIFVAKILKIIILFYFQLIIPDANTPFRLMSATSLREILVLIPENHNLSNVLLTIFYYKNKKKIQYYDITFRPRQNGINSINFRKIVKIGFKTVKDFANLK